MINKKAESNVATFLTKGLVVAVALIVLYVILAGIFVSAGGVGALFNISTIIVGITNVLVLIPAWGWIILAVIILFNLMFGGKRR